MVVECSRIAVTPHHGNALLTRQSNTTSFRVFPDVVESTKS